MSMSIRTKLLILFTVLYALLFLVGGILVQGYAVSVAKNEIQLTLVSAATGAASAVNAADMQELAAMDTSQLTFDPKTPYWGITDPAYRRLCDLLATTKALGGTITDPVSGKQVTRLTVYAYVLSDQDPTTVRYIGSASAVKNPPGGAKLGSLYKTQPQGTTNYMIGGLTQTMVNLDYKIKDTFGTWFSAFAPVKLADGTVVGAVGVDMQNTTVAAIYDTINEALLISFVVAFVILFALVWIASRMLTAPLSKLSKAASLVAEGNYATELPTRGRFPDETVQLARDFETMVGKVAKREETLKKEVVQLRVEIDEAKRATQVSEIVESEFFRDLQLKAQSMRSRRNQSASTPAATDGTEKSAASSAPAAPSAPAVNASPEPPTAEKPPPESKT